MLEFRAKVREGFDESIKENYQILKYYNSIRFTTRKSFYIKWKESGLFTSIKINLMKNGEDSPEFC